MPKTVTRDGDVRVIPDALVDQHTARGWKVQSDKTKTSTKAANSKEQS